MTAVDQLEFRFRLGHGGEVPRLIRQSMDNFFLAYEEQEIEVKMRPPKRSSSANRFYWKYRIRPIADALREAGVPLPEGYKRYEDYVHESLANELLGIVILKDWQGKEIRKRRSTTDLSRKEFTDYVTQIEAHNIVLQFGIYLEPMEHYQARTGERVLGSHIEEGEA